MDEQIHYDQAPITEAILDIRVEMEGEVTLQTLALAGDSEKELYPTRRDRLFVEGEWSLGSEMSIRSKQTQLGYLFVSQDVLQIFQYRLDGFTFSRLKPYTNWEHFCGEGRRLWQKYKASVPIANVTRIALRYINRFDIPLVNGMVDFNDYLRTVPEVSRDLPQGLSGFFMQVQIPLAGIKGTAVINEALVEPAAPESVSILLDIDLFRTDAVPQEEADLWEAFEQLRVAKNSIFEASITENARRLIH